MSKFCFSVTNLETRHEGVVESDSFKDAVNALGKHVTVRRGDFLEIGVNGFPPARYECVGAIGDGLPMWMPANKLAA